MTVTRSTVARLRRQMAEYQASLPPLVCVADPDDAAQVDEARRAVEAARAAGRRGHVILVDREET